MSDIGKIIAAGRKQKGILLKQLAKQCGVSETYIIDLEAGRKIANETLLKKLSKLLDVKFDVNLDEMADNAVTEVKAAPPVTRAAAKKPVAQEPLSEQWEMAFGNVLRKVPIYDLQTWNIKDYRLQPVLNNKIDGFAPDKVVFVAVADDTLSGLGLKNGDFLKVVLNRDIVNNGVYLINSGNKRRLQRIKKLDGEKILLMDFQRDPKTEVRTLKEIEIIGRCISAEIFF